MPCVAKHLLSFVLSTTPGNFFALNTVNTSLKHAASTGALPVLILAASGGCVGLVLLVVGGTVVEDPTFTKLKRSLGGLVVSERVAQGE